MKSRKDFPKLSYKELKERLTSIKDNEHRIMLYTIYAGCARVGEIVKNRYHSDWKSFGYSNLDINPSILLLKIKTEKTHLDRRVPLSRIDNYKQIYFKNNEAWLTEPIIRFYSLQPDFNWQYSTRWAQNVFKIYFPEFNNHIHYLRHWRATHLRQGIATGVPLPLDIIKKIGGWVSIKIPEQTYEHSIIEDFIVMDDGDAI